MYYVIYYFFIYGIIWNQSVILDFKSNNRNCLEIK